MTGFFILPIELIEKSNRIGKTGLIRISKLNYFFKPVCIKKQVCKPDSVPDFHLDSIIYLVPLSLTESISLPPGSGRAVLFAGLKTDNSRYIWPFNP